MTAGITGHQNINPAVNSWIKEAIKKELKPFDISIGYTCLAIGADQLFAEVLFNLNIQYTVIIPCIDYNKTFNLNTVNQYYSLLEKSAATIMLSNMRPTQYAFYEAGKKVVELSDIMLAIWDGKKARGLGGTADVVEYTLSLNKKIIHLNPITKTIKHLNHG